MELWSKWFSHVDSDSSNISLYYFLVNADFWNQLMSFLTMMYYNVPWRHTQYIMGWFCLGYEKVKDINEKIVDLRVGLEPTTTLTLVGRITSRPLGILVSESWITILRCVGSCSASIGVYTFASHSVTNSDKMLSKWLILNIHKSIIIIRWFHIFGYWIFRFSSSKNLQYLTEIYNLFFRSRRS
jgi:hypothetical protein